METETECTTGCFSGLTVGKTMGVEHEDGESLDSSRAFRCCLKSSSPASHDSLKFERVFVCPFDLSGTGGRVKEGFLALGGEGDGCFVSRWFNFARTSVSLSSSCPSS